MIQRDINLRKSFDHYMLVTNSSLNTFPSCPTKGCDSISYCQKVNTGKTFTSDNTFLAKDKSCLLITFAIRLDPDQDQQICRGPDMLSVQLGIYPIRFYQLLFFKTNCLKIYFLPLAYIFIFEIAYL